MHMPGQPPVQINVPPEHIAGVYAHIVGVTATPYDFAIDFAINQPHASGPAALVGQVVARVRIPPTIVFDLLQGLNEALGQYEETFGPIRQPGEDNEEEP